MDKPIIEMNDMINSMSIGSSALIKKNVNGRMLAFMVIKDSIRKIMSSYWEIEPECRGAIISSNGVVSCHVVLKISARAYTNYCSFHFNYFDEESLSMIIALMNQKKMHLILCSENNECMEIVFKNSVKRFFRKYIKKVLKSGLYWTPEQYESSIQNIALSFEDIENFWDNLGGNVELYEISS